MALPEWIMALGSGLGGAVGLALLRIFGGQVLEKVVAWVSFKTLRWISQKTTNKIDGDIVKEAEVAYYGSEKFPVRDVEMVDRARAAASSEHLRVDPTFRVKEFRTDKSKPERFPSGEEHSDQSDGPRGNGATYPESEQGRADK